MRKLQKSDDAFRMNSSQLVDVAFKVFNNREQQQKKEDAKWNATFLAVELNSQKVSNPKRGEPPLGREQCAYCKEEGHWEKDCPRLKDKKKNYKRKIGASHLVEREEH